MIKRLFIQALCKFAAGASIVALLLFGSAGTLAFWNGWLLMVILFIPMFLAGVVMLFKNPELLKKRLNMKERQSEQRRVVVLSGGMFVLGFILAGIDHRLAVSPLPEGVSIGAAAVFLLAYLLYAQVLRENAYLSRVIEVQENQKVIDTGLYGIVRHPMYAATVLLFLMMPLVLGSLLSFAVFLCYPLIIAKRIKAEEHFLQKELEGYAEYQQKVKYRLIPFVW